VPGDPFYQGTMKTTLVALCLTAATAGAAHAKLVTRPVAYEHAGAKLEGYLAYDDAKTSAGKLPGVLVVHEWWGLNAFVKGRADELAKLGYVAFALDMYGKGMATEDPAKAGELASQFHGKPLMAERARAGLDQLLKTGLVDDKQVAAIGFCFGGSAAQALGYSGAPLAAVVSFHGAPVDAPAGAKVAARYLLLNGAADPTVKPEQKAAWLKSLDAAKIDFVSIDYGAAVHAFMNPDADKIAARGGGKMRGVIGYNATAARRAWAQMQSLFAELFHGTVAH
jgi:dienelactone hydrolase